LKSYEVTAIAASAVIVAGLFWYVVLVSTRRIKTVVTSWIVSAAALLLSLVTYLSSPNANWLGGSLNVASAFAVTSTLVAVLIVSWRDKQKIEFNAFQKKCLGVSIVITVLWIVIVWGAHGTGVIPNLLTQLLLVISYGMLIMKSWKAKKNTESLVTWWCVFISSVIGLYTAWEKTDWLALVYAMRSTIMCGVLVYTLHRLEWKGRTP
jgi:uncharacterized membrane protein